MFLFTFYIFYLNDYSEPIAGFEPAWDIILLFTRQALSTTEPYRQYFEGRVGFEPTMEFTLTRLTVWTFRPTKATDPNNYFSFYTSMFFFMAIRT